MKPVRIRDFDNSSILAFVLGINLNTLYNKLIQIESIKLIN